MEKKEWLTPKEVAQITGVTVNRVYNWRKEGKIKPHQLRYGNQGFKKRIFIHRSFITENFGREVQNG